MTMLMTAAGIREKGKKFHYREKIPGEFGCGNPFAEPGGFLAVFFVKS